MKWESHMQMFDARLDGTEKVEVELKRNAVGEFTLYVHVDGRTVLRLGNVNVTDPTMRSISAVTIGGEPQQ